jgi:hypothetical protein
VPQLQACQDKNNQQRDNTGEQSGRGSHEVDQMGWKCYSSLGFRLLPNKHTRNGNSVPVDTKVEAERLSYG